MALDNKIVVERDYRAEREKFLAGLKDEKFRALFDELGDHPYYYPQIFTKTEGWGAKGAIKNKVALLKKLEPLFEKLLFPGEEVRFVTRGTYCSFAEQYFLGWMAYMINQTVFLYTNYRIVMMNSNSQGKPLQMKWHIPYDQIAKFSAGGFFSVSTVFKLKDRKKLTFSGTPKADRKELKEFVTDMVSRAESEEFHMPHFQGRDNLCPECFQPVEPGAPKCAKCEEEFIKPSRPALMSLALPCLGDFYMGHYGLACVEILGYLVTWGVFFALMADEGPKAAVFVLPFLVAAHVVDSLLTLHMAKKGLLLQKKAWRSH